MGLAINKKDDSSKPSKIWKKFLQSRFLRKAGEQKAEDYDLNITPKKNKAKLGSANWMV